MNIIELAKQAGFERLGHDDDDWACYPEEIEAFAKLVVANIDPKSFMTWDEGYAAGITHEREECAKICEANGLFMTAREIRARSKA